MTDPRIAIISKRLEKIANIIAVSSGKGGVGKSIIATSLSLNFLDKGYKVGLLDLDFTSPSTHVILGVEGLYPKEEYGIIPPMVNGLKYMSITYYSVDEPTPLRGEDVSNAIIELMAITRWGELDYLVIDMPPGIGDATLDAIRLIPGIQFLIITTPSRVAYQSVKRLALLLKELKIPVLGVIENMVFTKTDYVKEELKNIKINYINSILFDYELEQSVGFPKKFKKTRLHQNLSEITRKLF
jgi:ATP-binding protein involved in chromosome partitioning